MKKKIIILLIFSVIALLFVVFVCFIKTKAKGTAPASPTSPVQVKISKTEAVSLAKEAALKAGYKVEEYNFQISEGVSRDWFIHFELKRPVGYFGGDQHFGVSVDKGTGQTYLSRGR